MPGKIISMKLRLEQRHHLIQLQNQKDLSLLKDSDGKAYVQVSGGSLVKVTSGNDHIGDQSYKGWSVIGAETVSGVNQIAWKDKAGRFVIWDMDSNWNQTGGKAVSGDALKSAETNFKQDFNSDGIIGGAQASYTTTESKGSVSLLKDSDGKAYIQVSGGSLVKVTSGNDHIGDQSYKGWSVVGAETVSGVNQIAWKDKAGRFVIWDMDSNWNQTGGKAVSGDALYDSEHNFQQDFNGDSLIRPTEKLFTPNVLNYDVHDLISKDWTKNFIDAAGENERINYYIHDKIEQVGDRYLYLS